MGSGRINFTSVTVLLNGDSKAHVCKQGRIGVDTPGEGRACMSKREIQHLQKRRDDEEPLKGIQAVYPQCADCLYHFKSEILLTCTVEW